MFQDGQRQSGIDVLPGDDSDSRDDATGQRRRVVASEQEKNWQQDANDYVQRFCGHCNTTTDIKEANFFGRLVCSCVSVQHKFDKMY